eukprot:TRINITY_DN4344_c0_g1_i5.p1 TRINITY_DN4344_c0_g1~~TRINITY_DN4344_c0_g1_i5.p1  ORF type:complete len:429 (-),score=70.77 TRINITY_DN4344_c0_g1_i5:188-1474(-)
MFETICQSFMIWTRVLIERINGLRTRSKVVAISSPTMASIGTIILVSEKDVNHLTNFTLCKTKINNNSTVTGLNRTRGALVCRFDFYNTSFCFVCVKLSTEEQDKAELIKEFFSQTHFLQTPKNRTISGHDYIFFFGDVGYQLESSVNRAEILARLENGSLDWLLSKDLLRQEHLSGKILKDFSEGPINFFPTSKFNIGIDPDTYVFSSRPGWTDRILWYVSPNKNLSAEQLIYSHSRGVYFSQHRPVKALFRLDIRITDMEKKDKIKSFLEQASWNLQILSKPSYFFEMEQDQFFPKNTYISTKIPKSSRKKSKNNASSVSPLSGYNGSLAIICDNLSKSFGNKMAIMANCNLASMTITSSLHFLLKIGSNPKAHLLAQVLFVKVTLLKTMAKKAAENPKNGTYFNELLTLEEEILKLVSTEMLEIL